MNISAYVNGCYHFVLLISSQHQKIGFQKKHMYCVTVVRLSEVSFPTTLSLTLE